MTIMTCGEIFDYQEMVDQLVKASKLPVSIIIIGIGDNDFQSWKQIDTSITPLQSQTSNEFMERDCVQFIKFNKYKDSPGSLIRAIMKEIPNQMTEYFRNADIQPNTRIEESLTSRTEISSKASPLSQSNTLDKFEKTLSEIYNDAKLK